MKVREDAQQPNLSPSEVFVLMVGDFPPTSPRLPGDFAFLHTLAWDDGWDLDHWRLRICTPSVAQWLEQEAGRYGFRPHALTKHKPREPGVVVWHKDFLATHGRHPPARSSFP